MRKIKAFLYNIRDNIAAIMFLAVFLVVYVLAFVLDAFGLLDRYVQDPNDYICGGVSSVEFEEISKHFLKLEIKNIEKERVGH